MHWIWKLGVWMGNFIRWLRSINYSVMGIDKEGVELEGSVTRLQSVHLTHSYTFMSCI